MKKLLIIFFLACLAIPGYAQQEKDKPNGSRLEALKIAYLTKRLNLSPEEAQRFWPIYNNYAAEIKEARIDKRKNNASELDTEERMLNIRKKYSGELTRVLNAEKVNAFFRSEKEFSSYVQKELAERRRLHQLNSNKQRASENK